MIEFYFPKLFLQLITVDAIYKVHYKKESLFLVNSEIPINPFY